MLREAQLAAGAGSSTKTAISRSSFVLVFVEARVLVVVLAPEVGALLALGDPGPHRARLRPDLDLGLGVRPSG